MVVAQLILVALMSGISVASKAHICRQAENSSYSCEMVSSEVLESYNLDLPDNACAATSCKDCVVANASFIITKKDELMHPTTFLDRPTDRLGNKTVYECFLENDDRGDSIPVQCDCSSGCTGTPEFCNGFKCETTASCKCGVKRVEYELSHIASDSSVIFPTILSLPVCIFRKAPNRKPKRQLLEFENAIFSLNNLNMSFHDPVVTVPMPGTLIARSSGKELVIQVKDDLNIILPLELLAYKDTLKLVFISTLGHAVYGEVLLEGKTVCRSANCVLCKDFLRQVKCWPTHLAYLLYAFLIITGCATIVFASYAVQGILALCDAGVSLVKIIHRCFKTVLRLFMLVGATLGNLIRRRAATFHNERNDPRRAAQTAILLVIGVFAMAAGECTQHSIVTSEIQNCRQIEGEQVCKLHTTAEITLNGLDYESCLWFEDAHQKNIFHVKIKLVSAQCSFSTKRDYFTFPVETRTISQLACPQNYYCAWGEHCIPDKKFEAITDESLSYPGYTDCHPSSVGSGCTIISRMGCLFYRVYFVPDLLRSYEVRTITGHECSYTISVERQHNDTRELLNIQTSAVTSDGIHLEVLGAYNQPQLHVTEKLVVRVGDNSEAYLSTASPPNRPTSGLIGQIQANTSYTKEFIFDRDIVTCDFFETQLRCKQRPDALIPLYSTKDHALPLTRDLHLMTIDKGKLVSKILSTAPVRVQMHFADYKVSLRVVDVCPRISDNEITTKGCYACNILSELRIMAHSSCHPGTVSVEFQILSIFTRTLVLETEPKEFVIKFNAEHKCFDEKICLKSRNMKHCKLISFCLDEPSIHLLNLNTTYTKSFVEM
ncbi:hypothetical protein JTE90_011657 [Oedothorax gibbosus]|uniref:Phlebovirus glycoprotein G2 fusion domain-containing protein n=1 Tax=Oedothorax gibbosus TaxID=931172 RepID=A0AAV6TUA0_9ARAC|nr:hypothetical protein JTE90_011657 [Oedothorax gibbosus]